MMNNPKSNKSQELYLILKQFLSYELLLSEYVFSFFALYFGFIAVLHEQSGGQSQSGNPLNAGSNGLSILTSGWLNKFLGIAIPKSASLLKTLKSSIDGNDGISGKSGSLGMFDSHLQLIEKPRIYKVLKFFIYIIF